MNRSVWLSLGILILALLWVASGYIPQSGDGEDVSETAVETNDDGLPRVTVEQRAAQDYTRSVSLNGVSQASRSVMIRAEVEGMIEAIAQEKGAIVQAGQGLARIEIRDRDERLGEAESQLKQKEIQFKAAQSLNKRGFNSQVRLAEAEAELETAKANLASAKTALEKLLLIAHFDGVLSEQFIEIGDYVNVGDPVYTLLDMNPLQIQIFVNENDVLLLKKGGNAAIEFLNGRRVMGVVSYISPQADPQTRTFMVEVDVQNDQADLFDGLTAKVTIPMDRLQAYQMPSSLLILADDGRVGVRVVDAENKVQFYPVNVLADGPDGVWVSGLPEAIRLITIGQQFVKDGQEVDAVMANAQTSDQGAQ